MAYSIQREVSNGTLQTITLRIQYFNKAHISVYVDDKLADGTAGRYSWTWDGDRIRLNAVVPNGIEVMIRRKTPMDAPFHNFRQGAVFKDTTMDENFIQQLYINQENVEGLSATDFYSDLDLHNYRLKNVGTAVVDSDAVSLGQYRADALGANQFRILAENHKNAAKISETNAKASEVAAKDSETNAKASEVAAKLSETNSKNSENIVVPLVPVVDQAAKDAAAASAQAASAAAAANQAVIDVKNLGAVPIGTVVEFLSGKALPAGYLDGTGATFDGLTYPDLQTYLGSTTLPNLYGGGDFLGKMLWVSHRSKIPVNYTGADGQSIAAASAPAMKAAVDSNAGIWAITEAAWQADPYSRGAFSTGDASSFRMPDINGKSSGSVGSLFIRGDGKDAGSAAGMIQGDAIRNITGEIAGIYDKPGTSYQAGIQTVSGAFSGMGSTNGHASSNTSYQTHSGYPTVANFDASRVVPTASENRPKSVTGVWCICIKVPTIRAIKAAGVLANEGMAQLDGVKLAITSLYKNFIGVPIPWGSAALPVGYIKLNGQAFDKVKNPVLALMYPSGTVPDLRGEFLRALDDGRGVDVGRVNGSAQSDSLRSHAHEVRFNQADGFSGVLGSLVVTRNYPSLGEIGTGVATGLHGGAETRPRNIAMLYICMTDAAVPV